jgi:hypothetical protein
MPKVQQIPVFIVALALLVSGCSLFQGITYYDPTTYKNLTDLKPEVTMLYETFVSDEPDTLWIRSIRLRLAKMYEYEKGKGEKNKETAEQIKIIRENFDEDVSYRRRSGPWSETHKQNAMRFMAGYFDTAIKTEASKNKNE